MMNRRFLHPAIVFFLLTLLVAFLSWVGSIYGWHDVQSLLSSEGLRWQLRNAVPGFLKAPFLGHLLILAFGIGLWMHSGLGALIMRLFMRHSRLSGKKKTGILLEFSGRRHILGGMHASGMGTVESGTKHYRRIGTFAVGGGVYFSRVCRSGHHGFGVRICCRLLSYRPGLGTGIVVCLCPFLRLFHYAFLYGTIFCLAPLYRTGCVYGIKSFRPSSLLCDRPVFNIVFIKNYQ